MHLQFSNKPTVEQSMRKYLSILLLSTLMMITESAWSQSAKGFDYSAHKKLNKQAGHWGKRRMKAADHDMTNIQCSVRKSRRKARKNNH